MQFSESIFAARFNIVRGDLEGYLAGALSQGVSMGVGVRVIAGGHTGYGFEELVREMVDADCRAVGIEPAR
jgi:hypothetical protein